MPEPGQNPSPEQASLPTGPSEAQQSYAELGQHEVPKHKIIDSIPEFAAPTKTEAEAAKGPIFEVREDKESSKETEPVFEPGRIVAIRRSAQSEYAGELQLDWSVFKVENGRVFVSKVEPDGRTAEKDFTPQALANIQLTEVPFTPGQLVTYSSKNTPITEWAVYEQGSNGDVRIVSNGGLNDRAFQKVISGAELAALQRSAPIESPKPKRRGLFGRK